MTQVSNETAALALARYIRRDDNANPDIGWGKSWNTCVDEALKELGLARSDVPSSVFDRTNDPDHRRR